MTKITSPLSGRVIALSVGVGDVVTQGMPLLTIESMKMEIPVEAEADGTVSQVLVAVGQEIEEGQLAMVLD